MLCVVIWSATLLPSLSSRLVEVEEPNDVDVVEPPPVLVELLVAMDVDVDEEEDDELSSSLVDVVSASAVVGVVAAGAVTPVVGAESSTEVSVAADELVEAPALVTDVEVPSSVPAHATPTTARAATIEVNTPSTFFIIIYLLGLA